MYIAHSQQWQLRNWVIDMSEAEVVTLSCDILGQLWVSHAGCSIRVHLRFRVSLASEVRGRKTGNGGTEAVACDDQFVIGMLGEGVVQLRLDVFTDSLPRAPETKLGFTASTDTGAGIGE